MGLSDFDLLAGNFGLMSLVASRGDALQFARSTDGETDEDALGPGFPVFS